MAHTIVTIVGSLRKESFSLKVANALAKLAPRTLALMHGPSFSGDGAAALRALADDYDRRMQAARPVSAKAA